MRPGRGRCLPRVDLIPLFQEPPMRHLGHRLSLLSALVVGLLAASASATDPAGRPETSGPHPHELTAADPRAGTTCGNGFCEEGEDHAGCPSDCCETTADGHCVAACGNGFCELEEDHASCPSDCCETTAEGYCVPV